MGALRQAFSEEHALQCGYCTPGMLIAARDLIRRKGPLSREDIRVEMSGNLCRCTGYLGVVDAIHRVMAQASRTQLRSQPRARNWLGPAPGPDAKSATVRAAPMHIAVEEPVPPRPQTAQLPHGEPIGVSVGEVQEAGGSVRLSQTFALQHPRAEVWRLMSDPEAVARCMPGARLDGPPQDGRITGRIDVKLGPVTAAFSGEGSVEQYPAEFRQVIAGRGGDKRSGSRVSGSVDYRLTAIAGPAGGEATRVDVVIGYQLTGLLAQFGRSNLARDVAGRMGEAFAQNLDARLRGTAAAPAAPAPIGAFALAWQVIAARMRALLRRALGS
jgi:aerobic carbon-monoxide dehydrogenase small subunit